MCVPSVFFSIFTFSFLCTCMYCTALLSPRKGRLRSFYDDDDDGDDDLVDTLL